MIGLWLMTNVAVWLAWQWTVIRGDMCQFQVEALKSQLMCDWPHLLFPFEWHLSSCQMLATHTSRVACAEEKWSKHQVIHWMCSMSRKSTSDSFFFLFDHAMGHARCYSPGQESHQLQCKHRDLTTGLPKKSPTSQAFAITGLFVTAA